MARIIKGAPTMHYLVKQTITEISVGNQRKQSCSGNFGWTFWNNF